MTNQDSKITKCQNCQNQFAIEPEDFKFYDKIKVPPPTFCPECRLQRRLNWVNAKTFYKRPLGDSPKIFISTYSEDKPFKIMEDKKWWSDDWDSLKYGKEYDFSKPFFKQFKELMLNIPLPHLQRDYATMGNSEYCNAAAWLKNCYLVIMADYIEDCAYCFSVENLKDCFDVMFSNRSELCYEGTDLKKCYRCFFSKDCEGSNELFFCQNCTSCNNCFGCINLRNKSYHIFNQPYSKEKYYQKLKQFNLGSYNYIQSIKKEIEAFFVKNPLKFMHGRSNKNVSGDYIYQSKNIKDSFTIGKSENCRYSHFLKYVANGTNDAYDYTMFGVGAELVYECAWCGLGISNLRFSFWNYWSKDLEYCFGCHSSRDLFGCVGLRHKSYCILNKQYTKEEYERMVPKIIEHMNEMPYVSKITNHRTQSTNKTQNTNSKTQTREIVYRYGEFFPPELSPFSYNETIAQEYFPLSKEQAISQGYSWKDPEERNYQITMKTEEMPDNIKDVSDSILEEVIECANYQRNGELKIEDGKNNYLQSSILNFQFSNCATAFRLIKPELEFLRKMNLPLPHLCPNCRHYQRIKQRNPLKLWHRQCQCAGKASSNGIYQNTIEHLHKDNACLNEFETTYFPERQEIIYCEKCYLAEVV